jgi:ABC-type glycerol-3-phosphate transport system substrate-binding protein
LSISLTKNKMKKFFAGFLLVSLVFITTGCEKKDPNQGRIIPVGQNYKMQVWTAEEGETINALAREFISATRTSGLNINIITFSSEEVLQKTLLEKMAEGTGPDVVFTTGEWIYKNKNKLIPAKKTEEFTADRFAATFVRSAGEAMIQDGLIYGMPLAVDSLALIYNEDHLISRLLNRNSPGSTWQEFREDIEKLTKTDNSLERFAVSGAAIGRMDNLNYGFEILENLMLQLGTTFFTPDGTSAYFASSVGVMSNGARKNFGEEAINFFTSFSKPQYKNYSWNEMLADKNQKNLDFNTFIKGKTSIVFGFSRDLAVIKNMISNWNLRDGKHISEKNIKVAFLPQFAESNTTSSRLVIAKVLGFAVPRTAENSELSWKFLKFLAKKEIASSFHNTTKLPTARLDLIVEQASDPDLGFFVRQAKFAKNNFLPIDEKEFRQDLSKITQEIVEKKVNNPMKLLKKLEKDISVKLKEYLSLEKQMHRPLKKVLSTTSKK